MVGDARLATEADADEMRRPTPVVAVPLSGLHSVH